MHCSERAQLIQTRKEGYRLGRARKVWEYFQWKSFPSSWCCALINDVMWVMGWRLAGDVCWHARELSSSVIRCRTNSIVMSWVPIMSCHLTSLHHYDRLPKLFPSRGEKEGEVTQEFHNCKKNDLVWHLPFENFKTCRCRQICTCPLWSFSPTYFAYLLPNLVTFLRRLVFERREERTELKIYFQFCLTSERFNWKVMVWIKVYSL